METIHHTTLNTPIGALLIASSEKGLVRIIFGNEGKPDPLSRLRKDFSDSKLIENEGKNAEIIRQLTQYFDESRTEFDLILNVRGTDFQKAVWNTVAEVPYGQTWSYSQIAKDIGNPQSVRAVGLANGANPIPIVIPCHRIVGADGSLTGYGGGIHIKKKLLLLEKNLLI